MSTIIDTGTDQVLASVVQGVGTITLNRPERRNALSTAMLRGIARAVAHLDDDPDVGCLVITGTGTAFCSGGDVLDFEAQGGEGAGATHVTPEAVAEQLREQRETVGRIYAAQTPVIASLPGAAAGAGLGLCLAADLRIGTTRTLMVTAFASVALSGDYGVAWLLHHLVGPAKARDLLFLSPRLDAQACMNLGLLDRLCAEEELPTVTAELAQRLADGPRTALRLIKQNLVEAPRVSLDESMQAEILRHKTCGLTQDHLGAIAAFARKQPPVFNQSAG